MYYLFWGLGYLLLISIKTMWEKANCSPMFYYGCIFKTCCQNVVFSQTVTFKIIIKKHKILNIQLTALLQTSVYSDFWEHCAVLPNCLSLFSISYRLQWHSTVWYIPSPFTDEPLLKFSTLINFHVVSSTIN